MRYISVRKKNNILLTTRNLPCSLVEVPLVSLFYIEAFKEIIGKVELRKQVIGSMEEETR